jgi:DNA-directed RNA polymerase subunit L
MVSIYLEEEQNTLSCALREALEDQNSNVYVSCSQLHPLDNKIRVEAPSLFAIRQSLILIKDKIRKTRETLESNLNERTS